MSKILKLNVFGDSYTTPDYRVAPEDSFWGLMSAELGTDNIENYSHPGFSLDHIIHIILNEDFDFETDYFVIGIPPLVRYVAYSDNYNSKWYKKSYSAGFKNSTDLPVESLSNTQRFQFEEQFRNDKEGLTRFSSEWNDVQCLEKIYLLHQYLTLRKSKFIMVNMSTPIHYQDMWPAGKNIMIKIKQLKECIIFDDTYYSVNYNDSIKPVDYKNYGWHGHHGPEGNKNWFEKIIKLKIKELGWINA